VKESAAKRKFEARPRPAPGQSFPVKGRGYEYDSPTYAQSPGTGKSAVCNVLSEKREGGPRKNCPVQLTFIEGRPYLRLCTPSNVRGKTMPRVVPLPANGAAANVVANRICEHWASGDKEFKRVKNARLEKGGTVVDQGLGRLRRR